MFGILYAATTLGITVGFHRLFTHRSFATFPAVRAVFAILGSVAIEGPVISWVADHRKHHAFSDKPGDPHSPHVDHGEGWLGAVRGLLHAHLGWLFVHTQRGSKQRYAPDLLKDPVVRAVDRTFVLWALSGFAVAFGLGCAIGDSVAAGLTALLWGGVVRMMVLHHVTYSVNSLCHFFGRRRVRDRRRVAQPRVALAAVVRRGLAQQPSRVPDLGGARAALVGDRHLGARHPRPAGRRPRVGRRADRRAGAGPQGAGEPDLCLRAHGEPRGHRADAVALRVEQVDRETVVGDGERAPAPTAGSAGSGSCRPAGAGRAAPRGCGSGCRSRAARAAAPRRPSRAGGPAGRAARSRSASRDASA